MVVKIDSRIREYFFESDEKIVFGAGRTSSRRKIQSEPMAITAQIVQKL